MDALTATCFALGVAGLVQSALMLLHAWEHRRYHRSRLASEVAPGPLPRVTLFVPCKGRDLGMEGHLRALFAQQYEPLEICFLVESEADPATNVIRRLQEECPRVASRLIFTGCAEQCGQKVHNLMRGTAKLPDSDVLAFVDSDAAPHPLWLARLAGRLKSGKFAVATGYRWYLPVRPGFANRLLSAINSTIAGVLGPHGFNLVWGGAWAIRTEDFRALGLPEAWRGSLSDDLVVSRLVHQAGLKVAYEPHCLVRSPADFTWISLAEFLRRQYVITRVYAPRWWRFAIAAAAITNLVVWGLAGLTGYAALAGRRWEIPALGLAGTYLLTALRHGISSRAIRPFVLPQEGTPLNRASKGTTAALEFAGVARISIWGWPLVSLVAGLGLVASVMGRTIVWRGIRYCLVSPSETRITARQTDCGTHHDANTRREAARAA